MADRLAKIYPACRHNVRKAALKIHACMSLTGRPVERLRFTAERVHDRKGFTFGRGCATAFSCSTWGTAATACSVRSGGPEGLF